MRTILLKFCMFKHLNWIYHAFKLAVEQTEYNEILVNIIVSIIGNIILDSFNTQTHYGNALWIFLKS